MSLKVIFINEYGEVVICGNCNIEMDYLENVDNWDTVSEYGVSDEQIQNWINKLKDDEGYLYQCPKCGKYEYFSEYELDCIRNPKEMEKIKNHFLNGLSRELQENSKIKRMFDRT